MTYRTIVSQTHCDYIVKALRSQEDCTVITPQRQCDYNVSWLPFSHPQTSLWKKFLHLLNLPDILRNSQYTVSAELSKKRKDKITKFHYFKAQLHGNLVYLNVAEETNRLKDEQTRKERYLYFVTDRLKWRNPQATTICNTQDAVHSHGFSNAKVQKKPKDQIKILKNEWK